MQKLFSRALEARSTCHCAICAPLRPGLVRKAGTLPARQTVKFGEVFTIAYGTVIGAAAYCDTVYKKRRRKVLDDAISGVLLENELMQHDQEARLKALGYDGSDTSPSFDSTQPTSGTHSIPIIQNDRRPSLARSSTRPTRRHIISYHPGREMREERSWQHEMVARAQEREAHRLEPSRKTDELMQEGKFRARDKQAAVFSDSIFPEERIVGKTIEQAWEDITIICNERNTNMQEISTFQLVMQLLRAYLIGVNTDNERNPLVDFGTARGATLEVGLDDIANLIESDRDSSRRIDQLKADVWNAQEIQPDESMPYPEYQLYSRYDGEVSPYHEDVRLQNEKLVTILLSARGPKELISNVCTFLMSCRCAPNIHTINLLLIHFLDIQWYHAAKVVVSASYKLFINQNEVTDIAKLQFFHSSQEDLNFDAQRAYMQAVDGRVTRAAYVPEKLTPDTWVPEQLVQQIRDRNGVQTVTYGLKATWTIDSFSIVIIDLLDRGKLPSALAEIATMRLSGFKETPEIVEALLQYSVFYSDWDIAVKTWSRSGALGHIRSPITWYWMLQACATCNQPQAFQRMVSTGQEEGILSSDVTYTIEEFSLCKEKQNALKKRVHAIRRLAHRILIPNLTHRDIRIQSRDFVLLPNLRQTLLVVYLQYAKLRAGTCGWSFDHLNHLYQSEADLEALLVQLQGNLPLLKKVLSNWAGFDTKLEAIAAVCSPSYTGECSSELEATIERIALLDASEIEGDHEANHLRQVFDGNPPAFPYFYEINKRQDRILVPFKSHLDNGALETDSLPPSHGSKGCRKQYSSQDRSGVGQAESRHEWVSGSDAMRRMVQASSNYAFARYWQKVLHPQSPANMEPFAVIGGATGQRGVQHETSSSVAVSSKFENLSVILKTTSQELKIGSSILSSSQLSPPLRHNDGISSDDLRTTASESVPDTPRQSHKKDRRVHDSKSQQLKKSNRDHQSNWTRIGHVADAINPTSLRILKDHSTHKTTDKGDVQVHVPWQSISQPEPREIKEDININTDNDSSFKKKQHPSIPMGERGNTKLRAPESSIQQQQAPHEWMELAL